MGGHHYIFCVEAIPQPLIIWRLLLLAAGADANIITDDAETPLHLAVYGSIETPRILVQQGRADINARCAHNRTPLMLVFKDRVTEYEIAPMLCQLGADPNLRDTKGETVFHMAARRNSVTNGILDDLVEAGDALAVRPGPHLADGPGGARRRAVGPGGQRGHVVRAQVEHGDPQEPGGDGHGGRHRGDGPADEHTGQGRPDEEREVPRVCDAR